MFVKIYSKEQNKQAGMQLKPQPLSSYKSNSCNIMHKYRVKFFFIRVLFSLFHLLPPLHLLSWKMAGGALSKDSVISGNSEEQK